MLPIFGFHPENRHTRLAAGISEKTLLYRGTLLRRTAQEMIPDHNLAIGGAVDAAHGRNVVFLQGGALALGAWFGVQVNVTRTDWQDAVLSQANGDFQAAPGITEVPMHRRPSDLPGVGASADTVPSGLPAQLKRIPAGTSWDMANFAADVAALAPPADPDLTIPVDRVISGLRSFPANTGYGLVFFQQHDFWGVGTFLRLYFGGPTTTTPVGTDGGLFCLVFRGSGACHLYEHDFNQPDADKWALRRTFRWGGAGRSDQSDAYVYVIPYAWDRMVLMSQVFEPLFPQILGPIGHIIPHRVESASQTLYQADGSEGQRHTQSMTGPGIIRLDILRTLRVPFAISRIKYPATGVWADAAFQFERPYPANTQILLDLSSYLLPGTSITAQMYDATTNAPLATPGPGVFLSNANVVRYFVVFTLHASADRFSTPILFSYGLRVNGIYQNVVRVPTVGGIHSRISLTGEDEQGMDHATGSVEIMDTLNQMTVLQTQDRVRSLVTAYADDGSVIGHLGEYEITKAKGKLRGVPTRPYPNPNWRDYNNHLVGMWARLAEARAKQSYDFGEDPTLPVDPDLRGKPPWRAVDIVRVLFNDAGFPDDELDLPLNSIRLWVAAGTNSTGEYQLQPGQPILPLLETLIRSYLLGSVVRDPNAGPRGLWRFIRKPRLPWTNPLFDFRLERPVSSAGKHQTSAGAYGAGVTWVQKGTFDTWPEAPLANVLTISGVGKIGDRSYLIQRTATHQDSISNPGSIHYVGRELLYQPKVNPGIATVEHADWLLALAYDELAFRRLRATFMAPMPMVLDPTDPLQVHPRPLRVYDEGWVNGIPFLLTSADIEIHPGRGGDNHMGVFEGYFGV